MNKVERLMSDDGKTSFGVNDKVIFQYTTGVIFGIISGFDAHKVIVKVQGFIGKEVTFYDNIEMKFNCQDIYQISLYDANHDILIQAIPWNPIIIKQSF